MFPYVIGGVMIVLAAVLAIATARGDVPEAEAGEDVDLTTRADWPTVAKLVGVMLLNLLLVNLLGWAITGALLFAGCAWSLGSRTLVRDLIVGAVLSVSSWYFFWVVLDVPLTPGILDGIWKGALMDTLNLLLDGFAATPSRPRTCSTPAWACCSAPSSGCCRASAPP